MSEPDLPAGSGRAAFHQHHQARATAQAQRLLAQRDRLAGAWLGWVASELYQLGPAPFVAMVRRELQRLS